MVDPLDKTRKAVDLAPRLDVRTYVLITPAKNEAQHIELTIRSVISQTVLPRTWVVVSDGSTDATNEIVGAYAVRFPWITFIQRPMRSERHFAAKVQAFYEGLKALGSVEYDVIGNLDADISFDQGYFEYLLSKFADNPRLGVCGTPFQEEQRQYDYRFTQIEHVSGACQLFRRECFESIGGYVPIEAGGIDLVAVLTARMKGWETRTFTEKVSIHHRKMGTGRRRGLATRYFGGRHDYLMGASPVWQFFRAIYQMTRRPYVIGGLCLGWGYFWAMITRVKPLIPRDLADFRRNEQMTRLRRFLFRCLRVSG